MRVITEERPQAARRGLATARAVLQVLAFLEQHPEGVRADDVAHLVGKSGSTAYYLLASLVEEGFAVHDHGGLYRPFRAAAEPAARPTPATRSRTPSTTCSCAPTSAATWALVRHGVIEIAGVRGRQGIARMPGLGTQITDNAHALAMGKVVLARLRPEAVARYAARGLQRYTPSHDHHDRGAQRGAGEGPRTTATRSTARSSTPTSAASRRPSWPPRGRLTGIVGLSASTRAFDAEHDAARRGRPRASPRRPAA